MEVLQHAWQWIHPATQDASLVATRKPTRHKGFRLSTKPHILSIVRPEVDISWTDDIENLSTRGSLKAVSSQQKVPQLPAANSNDQEAASARKHQRRPAASHRIQCWE